MQLSRREFVSTMAAAGLTWNPAPGATCYVRYEQRGKRAYGVLENDVIREIRGDLLGARRPTGRQVKMGDVKLLCPCEPKTVLAVGLNYKSHLGARPAPTKPEFFFKPITSLVAHGEEIVIPPGATNAMKPGDIVEVDIEGIGVLRNRVR